VRDNRARWALEEAGLQYDVFLVDDETLDGNGYRAWNPFGQVPAYRDDGIELFESGAILLHLAQTTEALAPADPADFARMTAWVIAALSSVEPYVQNYVRLDVFHADQTWVSSYRPIAEAELRRRLAALARWLDGREFLEARFTVGDIAMSSVLRDLTESGILNDYPAVAAYLERCIARPAFKRAIDAQLEGYRSNAPARTIPE
ncbi:MAG: glutathione S-transferase family protein, partial [Sphingomonas sp.]